MIVNLKYDTNLFGHTSYRSEVFNLKIFIKILTIFLKKYIILLKLKLLYKFLI